MKKTMKILSALALGAVLTLGSVSCNVKSESGAAVAVNDSTAVSVAGPGSIVYVNIAKVMLEYGMAVDLSTEFNSKRDEVQKEIERRQKNLQSAYNKFQKDYGNGLFTPSVAETKMKNLQSQETSLGNYVQEKTAEIETEGLTISNQINSAIGEFIIKYREEKGYAMILLSENDLPDDGVYTIGTVLAADASLDITDAVIAGLNAEYQATSEAEKKAE